jgi:hypothetical protein
VSRSGPAGRASAGWIAVLVALAAIGLVLAASRSGRTATVTPVTTASPPASGPAPVTVSPPPRRESADRGGDRTAASVAIDAFLGLMVAAVLVLSGYLAWTWLRRADRDRLVRRRNRLPDRPATPPAVPDRPLAGALTEAVDEGLRQLDEEDPQEAVIACWVLLEQAAAAAGTARRPSQTPTQLVTRVLAEHLVTREALDRLVELYREARYSQHVLGAQARAEARTALERVRRELTGGVRLR